ncbi:unnamed protein product [Pleuronectes platessa]|uniref:Uncharacterized protein n=1 Tax=Pleuronectes platessa TaxID=8262 RepID=A0A9N7TQL4_PLEPL|nr:unnamed protein product [Pleuronectes platessa]
MTQSDPIVSLRGREEENGRPPPSVWAEVTGTSRGCSRDHESDLEPIKPKEFVLQQAATPSSTTRSQWLDIWPAGAPILPASHTNRKLTARGAVLFFSPGQRHRAKSSAAPSNDWSNVPAGQTAPNRPSSTDSALQHSTASVPLYSAVVRYETEPDNDLLGRRMIAASQRSHLPAISSRSSIPLPGRDPASSLSPPLHPSASGPHEINNNTQTLFLLSGGVWPASSVKVTAAIQPPYPHPLHYLSRLIPPALTAVFSPGQGVRQAAQWAAGDGS